MIFYLTNDAKFHIYYNNIDVIYMEYWDALKAPALKTVRWIQKDSFKNEHLENIINYLKSTDEMNRKLGKELLEQTMKMKIYGEVVGHYEGTSI